MSQICSNFVLKFIRTLIFSGVSKTNFQNEFAYKDHRSERPELCNKNTAASNSEL